MPAPLPRQFIKSNKKAGRAVNKTPSNKPDRLAVKQIFLVGNIIGGGKLIDNFEPSSSDCVQ